MAENEGMEFEKRILEAIEDLKTGQTTISTEGIEVTNYGEQYTIKLKGITFGIIDKEGKFRVGTRDKDGKPIEDTEHFSTKEVAQMRPVINLGDGRKNVEKTIPLQTIEMKNPAKQNGEEDVQDRFIIVDIEEGGYPRFTVVEQSRETGELVGERIEIGGREYNTHEMNERTNNRSGGQTPGETAKNYESIEGSSKADDGIQPKETDKETFKELIKQDLTKTYGPMPDDILEAMTEDVMKRIEAGEKRDEAIARVGIEERKPGGRTPGQPRDKRGE